MTTKRKAQKIYDIYYYKLYELSSYAVPKDINNQAKICTITDIKNTLKSLGNIECQSEHLINEEQEMLEVLEHAKKL